MAKNEIVFFIDKQKFTTSDESQTAADLLRLAEEDPAQTTLVLKHGNDLRKFNDCDEITLKSGLHFVVFHDGPTPVSYYGPDRFLDELTRLGYKPELITAPDNNRYVILRDYVIELGRFTGRRIDLGLLATNDFPASVASAIHIKADPQLLEKSDSVPNLRNITDSKLGPEWRYWSINFNWESGCTARRLMSKINAVFQKV